MISLNSLEWKSGPFRRTLWRGLLALLQERTILRGHNVRLRRTPDGVVVTGTGSGRVGGDVSHPWQMQMDEEGEGDARVWKIRFQRGLVNGVEATIGGKAMSFVDPATDEAPALEVRKTDFGEDGVCRIYAKIGLSPQWDVDTVQMAALPRTPAKAAWTDFMLIGFLLKDSNGDVRLEQHRFFDVQWAVSGKKATGYGVYLRGAL